MEHQDLKQGVYECIEFLQCHGVLLNGLLLWLDIKRKTTAENVWKSQAITKFTKEEITAAKDELWKTAGEAVLGKAVRRQGNLNQKWS